LGIPEPGFINTGIGKPAKEARTAASIEGRPASFSVIPGACPMIIMKAPEEPEKMARG